MKFLRTVLLLLAGALLAQDSGLSVVCENRSMKILRRNVDWFEFDVVNNSAFSFDSLRVEIRYETGVRPLESTRWKGRTSFSHPKGMQKIPGKRIVRFDLPSIEAGETVRMWIGFVGEKSGEYTFSVSLFLLDGSGNWTDANEIVSSLISEIKSEPIDTQIRPTPLNELELEAEEKPIAEQKPEVVPQTPSWAHYFFIIAVIIAVVAIIYFVVSAVGASNSRKKQHKKGAHSFYKGTTDFEFIPDLERFPGIGDQEQTEEEKPQKSPDTFSEMKITDESKADSAIEEVLQNRDQPEENLIKIEEQRIEQIIPYEKPVVGEPEEEIIEKVMEEPIGKRIPGIEYKSPRPLAKNDTISINRLLQALIENRILKQELERLLKSE